jgi:hypothetical protein
VVQQLANANFTSDFWGTFRALGRHHVVERTAEEVGLCAEIMAESRRNPEIARIFQAFDADVKARLVDVLRAAAKRGDIAPTVDLESAVTMLMAMVDGIWWRRAVDPNFDAEAVLPVFLTITRQMLGGGRSEANGEKSDER